MMKFFWKPKVLAVIVACVLVVLYFTASSMHARLTQQDTKEVNTPDDKKASGDSLLDKGTTLQEVEKLLFSGEEISDSDFKLAELVRFKYIEQPAASGTSYNLEQPNKKDYSRGQSTFINEVLHDKKGGFFIDIGAGDGESESISLFLEKEMDWTGLLIEPNPKTRQKLLAKKRHARVLRGCVNPARAAALKTFSGSAMESRSAKEMAQDSKQPVGRETFSVMCFSFYTIMTALGRRQIDLLTVDVHGKELNILESIPFDILEVNIVSVEHMLGVADDIIRLMESRGFSAINLMENKVTDKRDVLFKRNRSNRH